MARRAESEHPAARKAAEHRATRHKQMGVRFILFPVHETKVDQARESIRKLNEEVFGATGTKWGIPDAREKYARKAPRKSKG